MADSNISSVTVNWANSYIQMLTGDSSSQTVMGGVSSSAVDMTDLNSAAQGTILSTGGQQAAQDELKLLNSSRLLDILA